MSMRIDGIANAGGIDTHKAPALTHDHLFKAFLAVHGHSVFGLQQHILRASNMGLLQIQAGVSRDIADDLHITAANGADGERIAPHVFRILAQGLGRYRARSCNLTLKRSRSGGVHCVLHLSCVRSKSDEARIGAICLGLDFITVGCINIQIVDLQGGGAQIQRSSRFAGGLGLSQATAASKAKANIHCMYIRIAGGRIGGANGQIP